MKNINNQYSLCKKGTFEPLFFSDAKSEEDFVKDCKEFFSRHPVGYYPHSLKVIKPINNSFNIEFTKIIQHFKDGKSKEYFVFSFPYITSNKGETMGWDKVRDNALPNK